MNTAVDFFPASETNTQLRSPGAEQLIKEIPSTNMTNAVRTICFD